MITTLNRLILALFLVVSPVLAQPSTRPAQASLRILADTRSAHPISPYITGKFCEHLGSNIYNGMCAQIVRNPTFADFPFWTGDATPDGRTRLQADEQKIVAEIRRLAARLNWPEPDIARLIEARADGLAMWWFRVGPRNQVRVSPDTGPYGGRAQRVEAESAGQGLAQWMYLPLHRIRKYEWQAVIRAPKPVTLAISLTPQGATEPLAQSSIPTISRDWQSLKGTLQLPPDAPANALYRLAILAPTGGHFVIERLLLWPADHIAGADPDIVKLLKESKLPILRWPGGNFVSGYHWEDGVGPMDQRPTRPNWAWGGVEPNLFGTDEFIAFCRAVGCEPMICVNAGDGSPREAARWVEYCNGPATSPMGAKRAANGHPQPYNVKFWEAGNELWGRWQVNWTTPAGNADRFREFAARMLEADKSIQLYACGAPVLWGRDWNAGLISAAADVMQRTTDHPLIGGNVPADVDPLDVYRDFMAVPNILEAKWSALRDDMMQAKIADPHLAITELQMFAHLAPARNGAPARLRNSNLVNPGTFAEAVYDTLLYHTAIRLAPFVDMITHSATVNHGGGLRKDRERVYVNPCYYANAAFADFAGATPVSIQLDSPTEKAPFILPDIHSAGPKFDYTTIAALAAIQKDGTLLISLVHRGTTAPVRLAIDITGHKSASQADLWTLTAPHPWSANTFASPDAISPRTTTTLVRDGRISLEIPPYTVIRIRVPAEN